MAVFTAHWMVLCVVVVVIFPWAAKSQIPAPCSDPDSLGNMTCCPNNCGGPQRGVCDDIDLPTNFNMASTNVRENWPHYFTRACSCVGNYGGYDCTRCKYGYYGENCERPSTRSRNSLRELSNTEWMEYIGILKNTRTFNTSYKVVLGEYPPGTRNVEMSDIKLYDLFVWQHHFAAKDSDCRHENPGLHLFLNSLDTAGSNCTYTDYAHSATGFPTWHRQYLLWFEWEIQEMIRVLEPNNTRYHEFRLHYWDWRKETQQETQTADENAQTDVIFRRNRLGVTMRNQYGQPEVVGDLVSDGWDTICWYGGSGNVSISMGTICNPNIKTGPMTRCPFVPNGDDPCRIGNPHWPTQEHIDNALKRPTYDTPNYETDTTVDSFRSYMEGYDNHVTMEECGNNPMCACRNSSSCEEGDMSPLQRRLHNTIHIAVGIADFVAVRNIPGHMKGVMADNAASPNDPLFPHHHAMVDCVLEEWLQRHPQAVYPADVPAHLRGHQKEGYIVPFFPLFKHKDMLRTGGNFGYSCQLSASDAAIALKPLHWVVLVSIIGTLVSLMDV